MHFNFVFVKAYISGGGGGGGGTCFVGQQMVLMADGSEKRIMDVRVGDKVQGRWGLNTVRGIEKPLVGDRLMWLINGQCLNTPDHPQWTSEGWKVVNKDSYITRDWEKDFELWDNEGNVWTETYTPCHPDDMGQLEVGKTMCAVPGGFRMLYSLRTVRMAPETQLYALALDECRTMYVDGYCFSGWADINKVNYQDRIGE